MFSFLRSMQLFKIFTCKLDDTIQTVAVRTWK